MQCRRGNTFISGAIKIDTADRILGFKEKPRDPVPIPGDPENILASMGIYVFSARLMYEMLCQDATKTDSQHDFGKNIIPAMIDKYRVFGYRFRDKNQKPTPYWRDVGTLDAYYQANMDLIQVVPELNLYDQLWPIRTNQPQLPPPKFVFNDPATNRRGEAHDSIVCLAAGSGGRWCAHLSPMCASTALRMSKIRSSSAASM